MATKLTKKQKEALTDKITGLIKNSPALRMTLDSSVNEMNINQISGELNRIHYRAIGRELPAVFSFEPKQLGSGDPSPDNIRPIVGYEIVGIGTVYGGEVNIDDSTLKTSWAYQTFTGEESWGVASSGGYFMSVLTGLNKGINDQAISSHLPERPDISSGNNIVGFRAYNRTASYIGYSVIVRMDPTKTQTLDEYLSYLTEQYLNGTPFTICYKLATPDTYTLTPQQMLQLLDQL